ncbi:MAG: hypothetical protein IN818_11200 [Cutibacterium sp.]|nr:hypothetical protein [Cutibacterium sp.]
MARVPRQLIRNVVRRIGDHEQVLSAQLVQVSRGEVAEPAECLVQGLARTLFDLGHHDAGFMGC